MTDTGEEVPVVLSAIDGLDVTVYEVIGSLENGGVNESETVVESTTVAVPTTGAVGIAPTPLELELPSIGMQIFYYIVYSIYLCFST